MKRFLPFALMIVGLLAFASCSSNSNSIEVDEAWKAANEAAFQSKINDKEFDQLRSQSNNGFILYKVVKRGESKEQIHYNSTVQVYYKGQLIDDRVFDKREFEDGTPAQFNVNEVIDGWTTALQYMHVGDKWEIWIPQQLGYGRNGKSAATSDGVTILPYSTLKFEVEIIKLVKQ